MRIKAFTPSREDPALLDERTAGRDRVLGLIARALEQTIRTGNRPHTLLVGSRGSGKSHVVEVALHRARRDLGFDRLCRVARLPEDAIGLSTAVDVLVAVLEALGAPETAVEAARIARVDRDPSTVQRLIDDQIGDLPLLLIIENLQLIMEAIGESGQADLRAWIEQSGQITVLATAPTLFHAIQSRSAPWFGSFAVEHLEPLSVDEGRSLVVGIAEQHGDDDLARFLATPAGTARLQAVHQLAGGSPRIWTIFASCVSIENLDTLIPAVEALLEELVPHYQQRLWELPATEQKTLASLAGSRPSATVTSIAHDTGMQRDTTATVLRRLAEAGWVSSRKAPGLDQRETWYELTEPLLRHHLQYRNNRTDELRLIVELLMAWLAERERRPPAAQTVIELARLRVAQGLGDTGADSESGERSVDALLHRVALEGDATAFAMLPSEIRRLLEA